MWREKHIRCNKLSTYGSTAIRSSTNYLIIFYSFTHFESHMCRFILYSICICVCVLFSAQFPSIAGSRSRASRTAWRIKRHLNTVCEESIWEFSNDSRSYSATSFDFFSHYLVTDRTCCASHVYALMAGIQESIVPLADDRWTTTQVIGMFSFFQILLWHFDPLCSPMPSFWWYLLMYHSDHSA